MNPTQDLHKSFSDALQNVVISLTAHQLTFFTIISAVVRQIFIDLSTTG